jgi:hypothetical protein
MGWSRSLLSGRRFVPLLTLVLIAFPVSYVTTLCHELGHGLVGLTQGFQFTGIFLGPGVAYALVTNSPLVSLGGWLGQYTLAVCVALFSWKVNPRSFTARSLAFIIIAENLIETPFAIASLSGDSGNLLLMTSPSFGASLVVAILEGSAVALFAVGFYFSFRVAQKYFGHVFPWVNDRRTSYLALFAIALVAAYGILGYFTAWAEPLLLVLFFTLVFMSIPSPPSSSSIMPSGPTRVTFIIVFLVFLSTEVFQNLILPLTIPL